MQSHLIKLASLPQQIAACPEIVTVLEEWDVAQTDVLLLKLEEEEEKRRNEEERMKTLEREKNDNAIQGTPFGLYKYIPPDIIFEPRL